MYFPFGYNDLKVLGIDIFNTTTFRELHLNVESKFSEIIVFQVHSKHNPSRILPHSPMSYAVLEQ